MTSRREHVLAIEATLDIQREIGVLRALVQRHADRVLVDGDPLTELVYEAQAELERAHELLVRIQRGGSVQAKAVARACQRLQTMRERLSARLEGVTQ